MATLTLAEKPSVGRYLTAGEHIITWGFGHLLTLAEPDAYDPGKRWAWQTLPMLPDAFRVTPTAPGANQLAVIGGRLARPDVTRLRVGAELPRRQALGPGAARRGGRLPAMAHSWGRTWFVPRCSRSVPHPATGVLATGAADERSRGGAAPSRGHCASTKSRSARWPSGTTRSPPFWKVTWQRMTVGWPGALIVPHGVGRRGAETVVVPNPAPKWVLVAVPPTMASGPVPIVGPESDSGREFIQPELGRGCQAAPLTFTRSRPYRPKDGRYVEEKNRPVVRRMVGCARYDTPAQLCQLSAGCPARCPSTTFRRSRPVGE